MKKRIKILIGKIIITAMFILFLYGACYIAEFLSNVILKMLGE